jgi:hypothetical protein
LYSLEWFLANGEQGVTDTGTDDTDAGTDIGAVMAALVLLTARPQAEKSEKGKRDR